MKFTAPRTKLLLAAVIVLASTGCDGNGVAGLLGVFGNSVTVEIENDTRFAATPELFTSGGRNIFEDAFEETEQITNFGNAGTIPPNESVTVRLSCDDALELIAFKGAKFENGIGLPVGDVDDDTRLRRDRDFDCNDVIRIRLTGSLFSFRVTVDVDEAPSSGAGSNDDDEPGEIADVLDDLFG